jgi:hypothetical protein
MAAHAHSRTQQAQAQDQTRRGDSGARQMFASILDEDAAGSQSGGDGVTPGSEAAKARSAKLLHQAQERLKEAGGSES